MDTRQKIAEKEYHGRELWPQTSWSLQAAVCRSGGTPIGVFSTKTKSTLVKTF